MNGISSFEPKGSSLKFGVVASGKADIYPRFEGSMEWDIAAGDIIASEAGCQIIDLVTRSSPVYNKPSMLNNPFIVYAPHMKTKNLSMPDVNTSS
jgi:3'(2'), 5'-bisphosphate nucleotidase